MDFLADLPELDVPKSELVIVQNDVIDISESAEIRALRDRIKYLSNEMDTFNNKVVELNQGKDWNASEKQKLRDTIREALAKLDEDDKRISEELFDLRKQIKFLQAERESAERQIDQLTRANLAAMEFATLEDKWNRLTAGAPWREWAKPHQIDGAQKIAYYARSVCADVVGLGKTLTAIMSCDMVKAATNEASPDMPTMISGLSDQNMEVIAQCGVRILYITPSPLLKNVQREFKRWAPHRSTVVLGSQPKVMRKMLIETMMEHPEYVVIVNYEAWRRDSSLVDDLAAIPFDTCILDEAHMLKDRKSNAYRGVRRILDGENSDGYAVREPLMVSTFYNSVRTIHGIPFIMPMTGTPILNRPQELYTLMTLVDSVHYPNDRVGESQFLHDYCQQDIYTRKWRFKVGGLDALAKKLTNLYFRRTRQDAGIELPPLTIIDHEITVDVDKYPGQAEARQAMNKWASIMLSGDKSLVARAQIAVYGRLRQIETWPAGIVAKDENGDIVVSLGDEPKFRESQKIDYIISQDSDDEWNGLIPDNVEDERMVLFSQFIPPLHEIKRRCDAAGISCVILSGDTNDKVKDEVKVDFDAAYTKNGEHKWDVVLCHYRVGGTGLNFTNASQIIILDEEWNPGKRDQAYGRIERIGQENPMTVHVVRDIGTIDDWLNEIIEEKQMLVDGFNTANENTATSILEKLRGVM